MKKVELHASYLGSSLFHSQNRIKDFHFLQDKLEAKLLGWRSKALSWAGRATMIRSVAFSLPTTLSLHLMSLSWCVRKWMLLLGDFSGSSIKRLGVTLRGELGVTSVLPNLLGDWVLDVPNILTKLCL
jgi:hypothetical protein